MNESDTSPLLAAALRYAAAGVAVFPVRLSVRGGNKKDVRPIGNWDETRSTDPATITAWWGRGGGWENAAIGIDCGASRIVGVDQDISDGKNGIVEWEKLNPTPTFRVRSASGGAHDYYRADPDHPITVDNSGAVADGVDIRGAGGFLIAPPSIDPRGGQWEWVGGEPDWANLPPVPAVVIERMENKPTGRPKPGTKPEPAAAPEFIEAPVVDGFATESQLFEPVEVDRTRFGPLGGDKTRAAAFAVMSAERAKFLALDTPGSDRSKKLAGGYALVAGHGVGVFWEFDWALEQIVQTCRENGFVDEHGERYAIEQASNGLRDGMMEPWIPQPEPLPPTEALEAAVATVEPDAVDALIGEMLGADALVGRPVPKYLIHGLLQFDSESWIIGPPGSKKSFVVLDMAARVLRGEEWQGRRTNPADVVMIVAEGAGGVGKRVDAWQRQYGKMPDGLYVLPRPVQANLPEKWSVLAAACARLAERAKAAGRGLLVILDTQARVTVGLKENDATDMGIFIHAVGAIRSASAACVLTVHHTGRIGGGARGSSAIDGAQTTELTVEPVKNNKLAGRLKTSKQKDIEEIEPIELGFEVIDVGVDEDGMPLTSLVLAEQGTAAFAAAWAGAEANPDSDAEEAERKVTPFKGRGMVLDGWIVGHHDSRASLQHWAVQALVDTAETLGLTQSEVKRLVEEKRGKKVDDSTWKRAWQVVVEDGGPWSSIVIAARGERWTVDRTVIGGMDK